MTDRVVLTRTRPIDVAIVTGVAAVSVLVVVLGAKDSSIIAPTLVAIAGAVPLLWRERFPATITVVTVAADLILLGLAPTSAWVPLAAIVALYSLTSLRPGNLAWPLGLAAAVTLGAADLILARQLDWQRLTYLLPFDYALVALAFGAATRSRRHYLIAATERLEAVERARVEDSLRSVQEERIRIARALHDDIAHHIAVVNAQAGAARYLATDLDDQMTQTLVDIEETSRRALDELRSTVSLLATDLDTVSLRPLTGLAERGQLLATLRSAGLHIEVEEVGEITALPSAIDHLAYRVLQEGLTNALKHGTANQVTVQMIRRGGQLSVRLSNPASAEHRGGGSGLGLAGLGDAIVRIGGTISSGMDPDERLFVLAVGLPAAATERTAR